jgi:hypothetical protein
MNAPLNARRPFAQQTWFPALVIAGSALLCIAALWYARQTALATSTDLGRAVTNVQRRARANGRGRAGPA